MNWKSGAHLQWLTKSAEIISTDEGKIVEVFHLEHVANQAILSDWAKHFRNHYCLDDEIDFLRQGTSYTRAQFLLNIKFPDKAAHPGPIIRSGDFGEVLLADYLEFVLGYWVPRTRYNDKVRRNESTSGSDIIGFKLVGAATGDPMDQLIVMETKAQLAAKPKSCRLQDAVSSSTKDLVRLAESLHSVKYRVWKSDGVSEALKIERFQDLEGNPYEQIFGAAAILLSDFFDEDAKSLMKKLDTRMHLGREKLTLIVVHGLKMMDLVHSLYERAANEA